MEKKLNIFSQIAFKSNRNIRIEFHLYRNWFLLEHFIESFQLTMDVCGYEWIHISWSIDCNLFFYRTRFETLDVHKVK